MSWIPQQTYKTRFRSNLFIKTREDFKKDINNSLKEMQENTIKQVKEMNKTIQNLKMELETIKKSQSETTLEI